MIIEAEKILFEIKELQVLVSEVKEKCLKFNEELELLLNDKEDKKEENDRHRS